MMIFQLTAAFLIRFVFTIFVIITNPRKWDTLSSLGLAGPFFRAAGSTNWKEKNENVVNDKVPFSEQVKVEKILKGSLDSIPSPSPSVKIQIWAGNLLEV